jgi:hypothetical protein
MADRHHPYSKPDQQGKFDGLCGVYAVLNSVKWLYHMSEDDLDRMFQGLCESLSDNFPNALWDGLGVPEIKRLLDHSVSYLAKHHKHDDLHWSLPFLRREFHSVSAFWRGVGEQISANVPTVVIIGLNKPWNHWTVAHEVTAHTAAFFDSYGMRRYPFTSFTLDKAKAGDEPGQKIMIDVHQSFRVSRGEWISQPETLKHEKGTC